MKVVGGEVAPAAALAPKCAPLGIPPKKVGEDIQKATTKWKGVKIQVEIAVQNRQASVRILPSSAPLLIECLKEPARDRKKTKNIQHNGNIKFDDVLRIAKTMRESSKSMSITLEGSVKEILGTARSLGCTIDGRTAGDMTAAVNKGEVKCS